MLPAVLIVHNRYQHQGGEEKIIEQQIRQLQSKGHKVFTYFEDSAGYNRLPLWRKISDAIQMPFSVRHYRGLRQTIRDKRPSIVHFHNVFPLLTPSVYYAARDAGVPVVQSVHNYRFMCSNGLFLLPNGTRCERCVRGSHWNAARFGCYSGSRFRSAGMALTLSIHRQLKTVPRLVDAFIAPSAFLEKMLVEGGFPADKITRLPAGLLPLSPRTHESSERTLLFVGRLSREKGLKTLLKAAAQLPEWTVQIAGDGPLRWELQSEIETKALSNVHLLGPLRTPEIEIILQKATALVLPSECFENLPTVILEAWFYGLPVIASRLGGMAELIEEGKTGFLFAPGSASDLAACVRNINRERSRAMGPAILDHFQRNFTPDAHYSKLTNVYNRVLTR